YFERIYEFYARLPKDWRTLRAEAQRLVAEHELIIGRMPGPFSRWVAGAAAKARKPMALFVAGDVVAGSAFDTDRGMIRRTFRGGLPFGEPLFDCYRNADIHIISSTWEGLPRCLAEGRAFCVPTIATAVGGIPSVVTDGEDALLVPSNDSQRLAAAIARLIDD